jgi:hypothetical protein
VRGDLRDDEERQPRWDVLPVREGDLEIEPKLESADEGGRPQRDVNRDHKRAAVRDQDVTHGPRS